MLININKPVGWTDKNMAKGWLKRVPMAADKKAERLEQQNAELRQQLEQHAALLRELTDRVDNQQTKKKGK